MNTLELRSDLHTSATDDNLYFVTAIYIDGEVVADFQYYATSLPELKQSLTQSGNYFILTCWCGAPGCAGIEEGVGVVHGQTTIEWTISQPRPRRVFTFESKDYERAVTFGIEQMRRDVADLWFTVSGKRDEKLKLVPDWDEDMKLLKPKERTKMKHRHRNA